MLVDVSTVCVVNTLPGCLRSAGNPKEQGRGSPEYLDGDRLDGEAGSGCCGYWSHWKGPGGRRRREAHAGPWGGAGGGNRHQTCNIPDSPPLKCTFGAQIVHLKKNPLSIQPNGGLKQHLNVATWSWQLETSRQQ